MGLILDSTVVIDAERAGQTAYRLIEGLAEGSTELAISVVTVLELAHGIARANTEIRRERPQRFLDDLLRAIPVHLVTIPIALRAGKIDGTLQQASGFLWLLPTCCLVRLLLSWTTRWQPGILATSPGSRI